MTNFGETKNKNDQKTESDLQLIEAVKKGDQAYVKKLLDDGADIHRPQEG